MYALIEEPTEDNVYDFFKTKKNPYPIKGRGNEGGDKA